MFKENSLTTGPLYVSNKHVEVNVDHNINIDCENLQTPCNVRFDRDNTC